ncbi:MAG TPA: hypothetical protein PLD93_03290, partial [Synergistaceae bacterium]|nr:hypothetical protein [Synergistaceae bacterium]
MKQVPCSLEPRKLNRLSNYENAKDNCSTSGTMGGVSNGSLSQSSKTRYVKRFSRSMVAMFAK